MSTFRTPPSSQTPAPLAGSLFQRKGRHAKCHIQYLAIVGAWPDVEAFYFQQLRRVLDLMQVTHKLFESHALHLDLHQLLLIQLARRARHGIYLEDFGTGLAG